MNPQSVSPLAVLLSWATPDVLERARKRAGICDDETLALLIAKQLNPFLVLNETEEKAIRRVGRDALRNYKREKLLPDIA